MSEQTTIANLKGQLNAAKRHVEHLERYWRESQERAERAEQQNGSGVCADCTNYQVEGPSYQWGYCGYTTGPLYALEWPWRGEPGQRIAVKHNFGCIKWASPTFRK